MILDSSALVSILTEEEGYVALLDPLRAADRLAAGAPTLLETEIVLARRFGSSRRVRLEQFVFDRDVDVISFDDEHWREAGNAFLRFGKGRHPAGLNYGDCMTYATARLAAEPLLCLGGDFALTDLDVIRS